MLESWLQPIRSDNFQEFEYRSHQIGFHVQVFGEKMPSLKDVKIALVGLDEEAANAVRKELYELQFPFGKLRIADLGNVRKQEEDFIAPLIQELLEGKVFPILLGGMGTLANSQFFAHKAVQSTVSMLVVDERIRYEADPELNGAEFLNPIFTNKRTGLFHFSILGYQRHFTAPAALKYCQKRNFDCLRLGEVRDHLQQIEPVIRDADFMSFKLAAINGHFAPGQANPSPNGFTGEEACQIARYGGFSDKLCSLGIYGYEPQNDYRNLTAKLIAQMIWYFMDGFSNRKNDFPVSGDSLMEYIVDFKDQDYHLSFWKSLRTGRWWLQVPVKTTKKQKRHRLIPCSYEDYQQACNEDLPKRLLNAFKRFG